MKQSVGRRRGHGTGRSLFRFSSFYTRLRFILILLAFVALLPPVFFHFRLRHFNQVCVFVFMAEMVVGILARWKGVSKKRRNNLVWTMVPLYLFICLWGEIYSRAFDGLDYYVLNSKGKMQLKSCGWLNDPPLVCAHGGDSTNAFPNTISAYNYALRSQVDCIELDVSRSSDGVLFALHDRDLQRISGNITSKVGHLTSNEIKKLDVNHESGSSKIPTIEDALTLISKSVRRVILDAKVGPPSYEKGLAKDILSTVEKMRCKNCLIWAKSDNLVRDMIKLSSDVTVGYVVMVDPHTGDRSNLLRMKGAKVAGVYHQLVDERLVKIMHGREKKVYAWTVDDADSMMRMLHVRADAIITSNPTLLQHTMQDKRTQCVEQGFRLTR